MNKELARVEQEVLKRLIGASATFHQKVKGQLSILRPFFDILEGQAKFPPIEQVDPESIRRSLLALFSMKDIDIALNLFPVDDLSNLQLDHNEYMFLAMQAGVIEVQRIEQIMGEDNFREVLLFFDPLTKGLARALSDQFMDFFSAAGPGLRAATIGHYFVFCAAFIGAVMINDQDSVKRLAPFMRTMAQAMVIGAPAANPGSWNVLCA